MAVAMKGGEGVSAVKGGVGMHASAMHSVNCMSEGGTWLQLQSHPALVPTVPFLPGYSMNLLGAAGGQGALMQDTSPCSKGQDQEVRQAMLKLPPREGWFSMCNLGFA